MTLDRARREPAYWHEDLKMSIANQLYYEMQRKGQEIGDVATTSAHDKRYIRSVLCAHAPIVPLALAEISMALGCHWEIKLVKNEEAGS